MTTHHLRTPRAVTPALIATLVACVFTALPASALYKVVGPDGKITYTDRPAIGTENKVQPVNARGGVANDVALPVELRQVSQRYPVTLYTTAECAPCEAGRQLLRGRGVPFSERSVTSVDDSDALERITGTRSLPTLTIGAQTVRGFQPETWMSYLDAAGYPKESRLPANFPVGSATPLTEARTPPPPPAPRRAAPAPAPSPARSPEAPASGIRF